MWVMYPPPSPSPPEEDELDEETKEYARGVFAGEAKDPQGRIVKACYYCGGIHTRVVDVPEDWQLSCPRIKSMQRDSSGALLGVEFWPPGEWETNVIFPADVQ